MTRWLARTAFAGLVVVAGAGGSSARDKGGKDDASAEMAKLEGNWKLTRAEHRGRLRGDIEAAKPGLFIEDGRIFWTTSGKERGGQKGTFTIDPTSSPKSIEVEITRGSNIGKKMLGIYEFKGNKLTICWNDPDEGKRPKKFMTKTSIGAGAVLETYQAVDGETSTASATRTASKKSKSKGEVDAAADTKKLEGNWNLTRMEYKGNLRPGVDRANDGLFIEDGKIYWTHNKIATGGPKGDFTIDPTTSPKSIDVEINRGSNIGKIMLGIYEIKGKKLTICWSEPGNEKRPKKFVTRTTAGAGATLETYEAEEEEKSTASEEKTESKSGHAPVDPAAETKSLEGNWKLTRLETKGHLRPGVDRGKDGLFIEDGKIFWTNDGRERGGQKGDVTIDPSTSPKSIQVEVTRGSNIGKTMLGIYELKGKKLTICWGDPGGEKRPKKFVTKTALGAGAILETYEKQDD